MLSDLEVANGFNRSFANISGPKKTDLLEKKVINLEAQLTRWNQKSHNFRQKSVKLRVAMERLKRPKTGQQYNGSKTHLSQLKSIVKYYREIDEKPEA